MNSINFIKNGKNIPDVLNEGVKYREARTGKQEYEKRTYRPEFRKQQKG